MAVNERINKEKLFSGRYQPHKIVRGLHTHYVSDYLTRDPSMSGPRTGFGVALTVPYVAYPNIPRSRYGVNHWL